jgi:HSP90 family molecular chaperone
LAFVISTLGNNKIEKASFWHNLGESLAVIDRAEGQPTSQMIRMMKSIWQTIPPVKNNILINPEHPLVQDYLAAYQQDPQSEKLSIFVSYMYEQALLLDAWEIESMSSFLQKAQALMKR